MKLTKRFNVCMQHGLQTMGTCRAHVCHGYNSFTQTCFVGKKFWESAKVFD